jgi:hypothetical protein
MSTEQAYIKGFVKRAAEYGYSEGEAFDVLKSAGISESLKAYKEKHLKPQYDYKGSPVENIKEHFKNYKEKHFKASDKSIKEKLKENLAAHVKMKRTDKLMELGRSVDETIKKAN